MLDLDEILGTGGPDALTGAADTIVYGLPGEDVLRSIGGGADYQVLAGGADNDTYRVGAGHYVAIRDVSGVDRLEIEGVSIGSNDDVFFGFIDGRHFAVVNDSTDTEVYLLDYATSSIETVVLEGDVRTLDGLVALAPTLEGFVGSPTWEEVRALGLEDVPTTEVVNQTIAAAAAREQELEAPFGQGLTPAEAQVVALLYEGALDRDGDIDTPGLNFWIDRREGPVETDDGRTLPQLSEDQLALFFLAAPEFEANFGEALDPSQPDYLSNGAFIETLYNNLLNRASDGPGFEFWLGQLERPVFDRNDILLSFVTSEENIRAGDLGFVETLAEVEPGDWGFA